MSQPAEAAEIRDKSPRGHSPLATGLAIVLVVLTMYVMSPVLFVWLTDRYPATYEYLEPAAVVFAPLGWLYERVDGVRSFYNCCFDLLGLPRPGSP